MLSKCANPHCTTPFQYFREGRIVIVSRQENGHRAHVDATRQKYSSHNVEHFWLCGPCGRRYDIAYPEPGRVMVVPRDARKGRGPSAANLNGTPDMYPVTAAA